MEYAVELYSRDPRVVYFSLEDFEEMKRIETSIDKHVTRFAAGDNSEHIFSLYDLKYMLPVENWTINWSYFDIANIDIMTQGSSRDMAVQSAIDLDFTANNIIQFRFNEEASNREMRILKMEGVQHP